MSHLLIWIISSDIFGKVKDRLLKDTKKSRRKAAEFAALDLPYLENGSYDPANYPVEIASLSSFRNNFKNIVSEIQQALKEPTLSFKNYHDLRKLVRDLRILYQLKDSLEDTSQSKAMRKYLKFLDSALEDSKDEFQDLKDDEDFQATLTKELKLIIIDLLARLE